MSALETAAASVTPPVAGKNTVIRTTVTSAERWAIPDSWRGAYVTFQADGEAVYLALGDSTVTADPTDRSTLASGAITASDVGECIKIEAGTERNFDFNMLSASVTHLSHISPSTNGVLRCQRSSGRVGMA